MNWSLIITAALALAAIISPIIVALLNNHHNFKIRKLELATDKKIECFERYSSALSTHLNRQSAHTLEQYQLWYNRTIVYVSEKTLNVMNEINKLIDNGEFDTIRSVYLSEICKQLQKDLGIYKRRI